MTDPYAYALDAADLDRLERLEVTRMFLVANIEMNATNKAMVDEFGAKLDKVNEEIKQLLK
jgi:hypothetical protein